MCLCLYTNSSPGAPRSHLRHRCIFFFLVPLIKINQLLSCVLLSGRHHDEKGDLKEWWTPESNERFLELSKCMVNQYSNFTVDAESGMHVCSPCRFLLPPHFNSCLTASGSLLITILDLSTSLFSASTVLNISWTRFGPAVNRSVHSRWASLSKASLIISEEDGCHYCRQPSCINDFCVVSPLQMNGKNTLAENIADNGGIRQAFQVMSLETMKRWQN